MKNGINVIFNKIYKKVNKTCTERKKTVSKFCINNSQKFLRGEATTRIENKILKIMIQKQYISVYVFISIFVTILSNLLHIFPLTFPLSYVHVNKAKRIKEEKIWLFMLLFQKRYNTTSLTETTFPRILACLFPFLHFRTIPETYEASKRGNSENKKKLKTGCTVFENTKCASKCKKDPQSEKKNISPYIFHLLKY